MHVNGTLSQKYVLKIFMKRKSPTIQMLEDVYADRKTNKKLMMKRKEELKAVQAEIKKLESQL